MVAELNQFLLANFLQREGVWEGLRLGDQRSGMGVPDFTEDDLNKLAFWCATGAGKTLMMQVHIKQYLYYAQKAGKLNDINNIILLTPNEELSRQHLEQLQKSNMSAELFSKGGLGGFFQKQTIQVIDINKLADTNGDKTVAVDSFEGNNLVLIDEAHKGSGGDEVVFKSDHRIERDFLIDNPLGVFVGGSVSASNRE